MGFRNLRMTNGFYIVLFVVIIKLIKNKCCFFKKYVIIK